MNKYPLTQEIRTWPSEMLLDVFTEVDCMNCEDQSNHDVILYKGRLRAEIMRRMGGAQYGTEE